ncbi:MAG TPA: hypothetical protein DD417_20555 [Elusimicrobia bacterium]|nr:hypothetical protein [Elusimicrobiota bacterium]
MTRCIPAAGINLFQSIYLLIREYEAKTGLPAMNLSLGNPDGIPPEDLRELQGRFARDSGYPYHAYAEESDLNGFAEAMVELHGRIRVRDHEGLRALPIAGIKTATAFLAPACGLHLPDKSRRHSFFLASNLPAYDVVGTWTEGYLGAERIAWPLSTADGMRLSVPRLEAALRARGAARADLIHVIRPGNPASVGASEVEWKELIAHCLERGTRLVNDAAYAGLADEEDHVPLAAVAAGFGGLEWMELYSVSKSFSDPGARLGAAVGTRDFISDFVVIKGNSDSGPVPAVMAAYGEYFKDFEAPRHWLRQLRGLYGKRLDYVIAMFREAGLRQACPTNAGFFTLWKVPRRVLGVDLASDPRTRGLAPQEAFNRLVICETGIVGVHFQGDGEPLIRYAVCADVLDPAFQRRFETELERLQPEY